MTHVTNQDVVDLSSKTGVSFAAARRILLPRLRSASLEFAALAAVWCWLGWQIVALAKA